MLYLQGKYDNLELLTINSIRNYFKQFIGIKDYCDNYNEIDYYFYEDSVFASDKEALDFLSKNVEEFFAFNNKYKEHIEYGSLVDLSESIYGYCPNLFVSHYVDWYFAVNYASAIMEYTKAWLLNHSLLDEEWYNGLCDLVLRISTVNSYE